MSADFHFGRQFAGLSAGAAAVNLKTLIDSVCWFMVNMQTSKTSIRAYRLKTFLNAAFFDDQSPVPFDSQFIAREIGEAPEFVTRRLDRLFDAKRVDVEQGWLFPGESLIESHRRCFIDNEVDYLATENRFQIRTPYPLIRLSGNYAQLLRDRSQHATLSQVCVELALWETNCLRGRVGMTATEIGRRINLKKSTLSTCIQSMFKGEQLEINAHPWDERKTVLRLNSSHPAYREKYQILKAGLSVPQTETLLRQA